METRKIGNFELGEKELQQFIIRLPKDQQSYAEQNEQYRQQIIDRLEEITLFAALGEEMNVEETDEYKDAMAAARRDSMAQMAMAAALRDIEIPDADLEAFYEENKANYSTPEMATACHILVDDEDKANEIKAQIESGEVEFAAAAKEHSNCPSKEQGGDLGQFGRGQMVPEFDEAVFNAEANTLIGPVKTQFGYHIIKVGEKAEASVRPYEEVKNDVLQQVMYKKQNEAYDKKLAEIKEKYL